MKYNYIVLVMIAGMFTHVYTAEQNPQPVDYSETLKDCKIVEEAFFLTVYRRPDGTHLALTAYGDRHIETEVLYNEKYSETKQVSMDEPKNPK